MRICRIRLASAEAPVFAEREGDNWYRLEGDFATGFSRAESLRALIFDCYLLAPIEPAKIVCVGLNYLAHVTENDPTTDRSRRTRSLHETAFCCDRPGSNDPDRQPREPHRLRSRTGRHHRQNSAKHRARAEVLDHIFGYTCANDVSDRVLQKKDGQWVRAKGYDTYCPVGPWIETELDLDTAQVESFLNGEARQSQGASTMLFPLPELISFMSGVMTLNPGDLILTGTPEGVGPMARR